MKYVPSTILLCIKGNVVVMNWGMVGTIAEILSAFGVILTLIYLAKQIKESSEVAKVSSYHEAIGQIVGAALDPDFVFLFDDGNSLTDSQKNRGRMLGVAFLFGHEILFHLYKKNQVDEDLWNNIIDNNLEFLSETVFLEILSNRPGKLSQDLYALIEKRLSNA